MTPQQNSNVYRVVSTLEAVVSPPFTLLTNLTNGMGAMNVIACIALVRNIVHSV